MTTRPASQCGLCAHFRSPLDRPGAAEKLTCDAFPDGIPDSIWWNQADHRHPYPGDHGVGWEPVEDGVAFPEYAMVTGSP